MNTHANAEEVVWSCGINDDGGRRRNKAQEDMMKNIKKAEELVSQFSFQRHIIVATKYPA